MQSLHSWLWWRTGLLKLQTHFSAAVGVSGEKGCVYIFSERFPSVFPQEFLRLYLNPDEPRLLPALGAEQQLQGPSSAPGLSHGHRGFQPAHRNAWLKSFLCFKMCVDVPLEQ